MAKRAKTPDRAPPLTDEEKASHENAKKLFEAFTWQNKLRFYFGLYTNSRYVGLKLRGWYSSVFLFVVYTFVVAVLRIIRPNYRPWDVIIAALFILVGGLWASILEQDWSWFARSGSLLVVIAALMHVFDAKTKIEKQKQTLIPQMDSIIIRLSEGTPELVEYFTPLRRAIETLRVRVEQYDMERVAKTYKKYELVAAILGTFVWGFGDLVGKSSYLVR